MLLERAGRFTVVRLEGFLWILIGDHAGGRGHFRTVRIAVKLAASKETARPERRLAMDRLVLGFAFVCVRPARSRTSYAVALIPQIPPCID